MELIVKIVVESRNVEVEAARKMSVNIKNNFV